MKDPTYTQVGDYFFPNIALSVAVTDNPKNTATENLGKYGRMRKRYLQDHRPGLYSRLLLSEKLYPHLREIDRAAHQRLERLVPQLAQAAGVIEELKSRDPMKWVGSINTCKAQAEEIILEELIYR